MFTLPLQAIPPSGTLPLFPPMEPPANAASDENPITQEGTSLKPKETPEKTRELARALIAKLSSPVKRACATQLNFSEEEAAAGGPDLYQVCRKKARRLPPGTVNILPGIENLQTAQPRLVVGRNLLAVTNQTLGAGAFSSVQKGSFLFFSPPQEGRLLTGALKVSTDTCFQREQDLLEEALADAPPEVQRGIDLFKATYHDPAQEASVSIHRCFDSDFTKIPYKDLSTPVAFILPRLIQTFRSLAWLHEKGWIHRDIKGANLLVNHTEKGSLAAVTDFNFLMRIPTARHSTTGTVSYLAPFIFARGLQDQIARTGMQTAKADLFAFGRLLQYDVLHKIFSSREDSYGEKKPQISTLLQALSWRCSELTAANANAFAEANPHRSFYIHPTPEKPARICFIREPKEVEEKLLELFSLCKTSFSLTERVGLNNLISLSLQLQSIEESAIPSSAEVLRSLCSIQTEMDAIVALKT